MVRIGFCVVPLPLNVASVEVWKNLSNAAVAFHIVAKTLFGQPKNLSDEAVSLRNDHILNACLWSWGRDQPPPRFRKKGLVNPVDLSPLISFDLRYWWFVWHSGWNTELLMLTCARRSGNEVYTFVLLHFCSLHINTLHSESLRCPPLTPSDIHCVHPYRKSPNF